MITIGRTVVREDRAARKLGAELEAAKPVHSGGAPRRTVANLRTLSWSRSADQRTLHALEHWPRAEMPRAVARQP